VGIAKLTSLYCFEFDKLLYKKSLYLQEGLRMPGKIFPSNLRLFPFSWLPARTGRMRLVAVDALRGFIIVLMALDHANNFIAGSKRNPEMWADLFPIYESHETLIFLTRLVTHLAAPGFFFLMGAGMILFSYSRREQEWSRWKITRHFLLRGMLLILLQFTLENLAWSLKDSLGIYFGVLYALGGVMIIGSLLLRLANIWLILLSLSLMIATELLLPELRSGWSVYPIPLRMWLLPGYTGTVLVLYPLMPWLGVTGIGMLFGRLLRKNPRQAYAWALRIGLVALFAFLLLRRLDGFGNIRPIAGDDWIAFLNLVKYPPSLTFLLLTLGTNSLLLALFSRLPPGMLLPLVIFGQAPLFFYIIHLFLYGYVGTLIGPSIGIPNMLPYWVLGLIILWPLCLIYSRFKYSRPLNSIWRMF
jgi:uncharacterized membrane protein